MVFHLLDHIRGGAAVIIDNYMDGSITHVRSSYFINNEVKNSVRAVYLGEVASPSFIQGNRFITNDRAIMGSSSELSMIRDNYFEDSDIDIEMSTEGTFVNNTLNNSNLRVGPMFEISNNLLYSNTSTAFELIINGSFALINNNIVYNNSYAFRSLLADSIIENCIIVSNEEVAEVPRYGGQIFMNCILDFEIPENCIDGGGNYIIDSLEVQQLFEDIDNGNFRLADGSIAIDSGIYAPNFYTPFDIDYCLREWDGDGDGVAVIDIGIYEYGAPKLGSISGRITESSSGEAVNYALIKINNDPSNYTFADSSGYFEIYLPEGTYDLYAERCFFENNIIYNVSVENAATVEIEFNMSTTLAPVSNDELAIEIPNTNLSNYPNPFNPSTTISFELAKSSKVSLTVYNIKGQKVKTLLNEHLGIGEHSSLWNGVDSNNNPVSSGLYLYKLTTANDIITKKMLLVK